MLQIARSIYIPQIYEVFSSEVNEVKYLLIWKYFKQNLQLIYEAFSSEVNEVKYLLIWKYFKQNLQLIEVFQ